MRTILSTDCVQKFTALHEQENAPECVFLTHEKNILCYQQLGIVPKLMHTVLSTICVHNSGDNAACPRFSGQPRLILCLPCFYAT